MSFSKVIMYIERILEGEIKKYLNTKEIIAVLGPRQCGKTTMLKHFFAKLSNAVFIDFEDRDALDLFENDIKGFKDLYIDGSKYVFIDEFQYAKKGGEHLKYLYDNSSVKFFITGSSATELSINGIKHLVGRVLVFNLGVFSFEEFLKYKDETAYKAYLKKVQLSSIIKLYKEYCVYGGYPRVVISSNILEKQMILKNIYNTYMLKEIRDVLQIKEDYKLRSLIKALALQIGGIVNYHELSNLTGIRLNELREFLSILVNTFVCISVKPFFSNKRKELVKAPKVFFFDNGFRNASLGDFTSYSSRADIGMLNENFVASCLMEYDLKYWRTKAGAEVDFVIDGVPFEVKTVGKSSRSFMNFISEYKPSKAYILCVEKSRKKYCVPIYNVKRLIA